MRFFYQDAVEDSFEEISKPSHRLSRIRSHSPTIWSQMQVLVSIPMKPFTCFKLHCCHGMSEKRTCRKLMCNPETAGSIRLQFLTIWKSCWQLASCNKDVPVCKNEYGVHGNPQQYAQILLRRWLTSFVSTSSANLITKKSSAGTNISKANQAEKLLAREISFQEPPFCFADFAGRPWGHRCVWIEILNSDLLTCLRARHVLKMLVRVQSHATPEHFKSHPWGICTTAWIQMFS